MKKIYLIIVLCVMSVALSAQNPTHYFLEGSISRGFMNPAFAPERGYINLPALGGVDANVSGNLSLSNIFYPVNGRLVTLLDRDVSSSLSLSGLSTENLLGVDTRVNLVGFGAYTKGGKSFWSVDLGLRTQSDLNIPKSLVEFIKIGKSGSVSDFSAEVSSFVEVGANYSRPMLGDRLYVGARVKFLMGIAYANSEFSQFDVSLSNQLWSVETHGSINFAGNGLHVPTKLDDKQQIAYDLGAIDYGMSAPAGYGAAIDLGASYALLDNLELSLAIVDLGFISWGRSHVTSGAINATQTFTGVDISTSQNSAPDFSFNDFNFRPVEASSITQSLRTNVNLGAEYSLMDNMFSFGALYTARVWASKTYHNVTGVANVRPLDWMSLACSYSVADNSANAVGLALNINPSWINFFVATDMLLSRKTPQYVPIEQTMMNLSFGVGIPIGRGSRR